jgi:DNA invertase Pin-like site-specific DNA recombinase
MSKVFGYMRVSQSSQTVENQKIELLASHMTITEWYADEGVSGSIPQMERKGFSEMRQAMSEGDTLVVAKLDRLGRNAYDVMGTVNHLKEDGIKIVVLQLGQMDVTSPAGKMMLTMLAAVAEMEMDVLKERIHAGLIRAKSEGVIMGAPNKIDPETLQAMCSDKACGATLDQIAAKYDVARATAARTISRWKDNIEGYTFEFHSKARYTEKKRAAQ